MPKFKLGFESLNKKLQDSFDQTSVAIRNKVKMLKETFGGQECTDLSSMVVPVLFQASMPPNIEQYLKSKTYVHNNRTVVNFKLIKTDAQSASQIVLSLIDIYMANIKCFKRYGIELHETSMIICMIEKLKSINNYTHNQDESELYVASLKKIAESCSGCIFVGADESCSEINKPTTIYSDAMIKYYHTFNKLYEYDGSEEERHNFAEIYAHIYAKNPKLSHKVFDVMPQYLQKAINIKPQREQSCSGRYLPKFFISQLNKENKNPDNNISAENNDLITKAQKRRTQSQ